MITIRMKDLREVNRLPVWARVGGALRLQWWAKHMVLTILPQCENCGIWYLPSAYGFFGKCWACWNGWDTTVNHAMADVLNNLTEVVEVEDG